MMDASADARKLERIRLIYHLRLFEAQSGALLGHVVDLTDDGMAVIGESAAEPGRRLTVRMDLPRVGSGRRQVAFRAECIWCRRDASGDFTNMGFRLLDVAEADRAAIEGLLRDFGGAEAGGDPAVEMNPEL